MKEPLTLWRRDSDKKASDTDEICATMVVAEAHRMQVSGLMGFMKGE